MRKKFFAIFAAVVLMLSAAGGCFTPEEIPYNTQKDAVTLDRQTLNLPLFDTAQLTCTVQGTGTPEWENGNEAAVELSPGANANTVSLRAIGIGNAKITVKAGTAEASCAVTVTDSGYVAVLVLNETEVPVLQGLSFTLTARLEIGPAENPKTLDADITFESSDITVAMVTAAGGNITGVAPGTTTVKVTAVYYGLTVVEEVEVTVIPNTYLLPSDTEIILYEYGEDSGFEYSREVGAQFVSGNEFSDAEGIVWETGDAGVAAVSGSVVTAVKEGETVLTGTYTHEGTEYQTVIAVSVRKIPVVTVTAPASVYLFDYFPSETVTVSADVNGEEYPDPVFTWESSDEGVAVAGDGVITAAGYGQAVITVTFRFAGKDNPVDIAVTSRKGLDFKDNVISSKSGIVAELKPGYALRYTQPVDFTGKTKNDLFLILEMLPAVVGAVGPSGYPDAEYIYVRLTDISDTSNYVTIKVSPTFDAGFAYNVASVKAGAVGQVLGGREAGGSVEGRQVLSDIVYKVNGDISIEGGTSIWYSFLGNKHNTPTDWLRFALDWSEKAVYANSSGVTRLVMDLDTQMTVTQPWYYQQAGGTNWSAWTKYFKDNKAYISVYADRYHMPSCSFFINEAGGKSGAALSKTQFEVVLNG